MSANIWRRCGPYTAKLTKILLKHVGMTPVKTVKLPWWGNPEESDHVDDRGG